MDGKWWGGYYGWRWPHGGSVLLSAITIAGTNGKLLTGEDSMMDLARSQIDLLWSLRQQSGGEIQVPYRHTDSGWADYRLASPELAIQLWNVSQSSADLDRILRLSNQDQWDRQPPPRGNGKSPNAGWFRFVQGHFPDYPEKILHASYREVCRALESIRQDSKEAIYTQHWIHRDPVICAALTQLTIGGSYPIYHGGLLHTLVRYYDFNQQQPGLPEDVAALIDGIDNNKFRLHLVNLSPLHSRRLVIQAGMFGEHKFSEVSITSPDVWQSIQSKWLQILLLPGTELKLHIDMDRYVGIPSYDTPWKSRESDLTTIKLRNPQVDPGSIIFE